MKSQTPRQSTIWNRSKGRRETMRLAAASALCLAAAGVWAGASAGTPSRLADCTPGPTKLGGTDARIWCGPAKATVKVAGKTYHFTHGLCQKVEGFTKGTKVLAVNIGTQTIPPPAPKSSYFGVLTDKAKGGTYKDQAVSWQVPGKGFASLTNKVVVSGNLTKGSFTGKASMRAGGKVTYVGLATGSWTC